MSHESVIIVVTVVGIVLDSDGEREMHKLKFEIAKDLSNSE